MGVQFFDPGGEPYFSLGLASNGTGGGEWSTTANCSLVSNAPTGRLTQYAISVASNSTLDVSFTSNFTEMWMGGAYYLPSGATFGTSVVIMAFLDGTTTQVDLRVNASGQLVATRNGTTLGTSTNALTLGQGWFYLEVRAKIDPTVGQVEVWVNNAQWLSLTGQNTRNTANTQTNRVRWGGGISNASNAFWKDMYTLDTGTGANTTRLGDVTVPVIYASGAGTNQQWSNTGGASQTASVQDGRSHSGTWPDGDTSYISDSVSGHISDFAHDALSVSGSIFAVKRMSYVRSDAGAANVQQVTLSSGTTHTSASRSVGATYGYITEILETDPHTSAAWTQTNFNSATFGVAIP